MANVDRPNGFRPVKSLLGTPWTALVREYTAADRSADTTGNHGDIYIGDAVALSSGEVIVGNTNASFLGVVVGIGTTGGTTFGPNGYFDPSNLTKRYLAYDEDGIVAVVPAEGVLFEIQSASDLDLVVGGVADVTTAAATAHGSRTTGMSTTELTTSTNADVKVVEIPDFPGHDTASANARYWVKFQDTVNAL